MSRALSDEIDVIGEAIARGNLVLLCGAGISVPPPSQLPLASDMVKAVAQALLEPYQAPILTTSIRPEMLFSYLYGKSPHATLAAIEKSLATNSYNEIHDFSAQLIIRQNCVITTNFDTLIEAALVQHSASYRVSTISSSSKRSVLFKIHGSINDRASLSLTLDQVGAGLGDDRTRTFHRLLRDRTVLVLGYSGNDQLDIMPALRDSKYRAIIWLDHAAGAKPRRCSPRNPEIRQLSRLRFWRGDSLALVRAMSPSPPTASGARRGSRLRRSRPATLTSSQKKQVVVEILMHENRYSDILAFVKPAWATSDLRLEIARFEAMGSISTRGASWTTKRDRILDQLFSASPAIQRKFIPTMAKFNHRTDRLRRLLAIELKALGAPRGGSMPPLIEAAIETLYELVYNHMVRDAEKLSNALELALERHPNTLLRARFLIEKSYLTIQANILGMTGKRALTRGVALCTQAIYLLGPDICNDGFFQHQARSNLGCLYMLSGNFQSARREFMAAQRYFRGVSINNYLTQRLHLATLWRLQGEFARARRVLASFLKVNRATGRTYWLGFAYREDAINVAALGCKMTRVRTLLGASARHFEAEENHAEARLSEATLQKLVGGETAGRVRLFVSPARP